MKKMRAVIYLVLALSVLAFSGCTVEYIDNNTVTQEPASESYEEVYGEYPVTKYELKDNAFETTGGLKKYEYEQISETDGIIGILNEYFEASLAKNDFTGEQEGYANWEYEEGEVMDERDLSVSTSTHTGKFSLYYKPFNETVVSASKMGAADEEELLETATDFVNRFSFVTGSLTFECSMPENMTPYPVVNEGDDSSSDVLVSGRSVWFYSEQYSRQTVSANGETQLPVEGLNEKAPLKDVLYFTVTLLADGTVVSAENSVTRADISENGVFQMITEKNMDKILSRFKSTKKDDKLVVSRIYVDSYINNFGSVDIQPVVKVEYYLESMPDDVRTNEFAIEDLY